jgi:hypothetical protein
MKRVLAAVGVSSTLGSAHAIDTGSLVREMIDLPRLAEYPRPAYRDVQFSSFDRRSSLPGGPGWFENSDGFGNEPIPNFDAVLKEPGEDEVGEYLICDVAGPGAIVRTWTAVTSGTLRLYLDDAEKPVYDGPAHAFLQCPYERFADAAGMDRSIYAKTFRQYDAGYCPIPFAKRCRMVWIGKVREIHFYQVQVLKYEPGTQVTTFRPEDLKTYEKDIRETARVLSDPDGAYPKRSSKSPLAIDATLAPRSEHEVLKLDGPQALERLTLRLTAPDRDLALRQTILQIYCDDYPWGQVQSPVGDFFGAAPGVNPYQSLPFTVSPDGTMTCRFVMPFASSIRIVLENRGKQEVQVSGSVLPMDYVWNDETSMHFRARWRVDHDVVASRPVGEDMAFLMAHGRGVYVGSGLYLLNPCEVPTPYGGWWGEGDEKIFVDDDSVPSIFGTGSEDYFNYSWSVPDIFQFAYCGQPRCDGPGNRGFVTNHRWHIIDPIPFEQRIAFYLELLSHERVPGVSYARIGYHYGRPGLIDDHAAIRDEDVRPLALGPDWKPAARCGARNQVFYDAEELVQPGATTTVENDNLWSGGRLLVWKPSGKGDQLKLRVPVREEGKHGINLALALRAPSGRISMQLDGKSIGFGGDAGVIDLHVPHRMMSREFRSEAFELPPGEYELTVQFEGSEPDVADATVGIDYLGVQQR